jgi:hypothetical protein
VEGFGAAFGGAAGSGKEGPEAFGGLEVAFEGGLGGGAEVDFFGVFAGLFEVFADGIDAAAGFGEVHDGIEEEAAAAMAFCEAEAAAERVEGEDTFDEGELLGGALVMGVIAGEGAELGAGGEVVAEHEFSAGEAEVEVEVIGVKGEEAAEFVGGLIGHGGFEHEEGGFAAVGGIFGEFALEAEEFGDEGAAVLALIEEADHENAGAGALVHLLGGPIAVDGAVEVVGGEFEAAFLPGGACGEEVDLAGGGVSGPELAEVALGFGPLLHADEDAGEAEAGGKRAGVELEGAAVGACGVIVALGGGGVLGVGEEGGEGLLLAVFSRGGGDARGGEKSEQREAHGCQDPAIDAIVRFHCL